MRRALVAGNWKMHGSMDASRSLLGGLVAGLEPQQVDVVVCPPFPYLALAAEMLAASTIRLGAQDLHHATQGAFTGEISGAMLRDCGCSYVIVGHSERRQYFAESDQSVALKAEAALGANITPIVCVGETGNERDSGKAFEVVKRQLDAVVDRLQGEGIVRSVIAYEPVWAIGTGKTAQPEQAQEMHVFIRGLLQGLGAKVAAAVRIVYGGSVKAENARELFSRADIDGALVGGASLKADEFAAICEAAEGT